ncbi:hypothetical protein B0T18DRAFT_422097 [Schizothecium vesticola]|uniref:Uncharacterized protein n=1 Tax=Schizothecium vesticola TaxID=314040 RepID=A0AA40BQI5_9PEZI|nr:hypothetical protein B0T18DRAFT_422097 [Schizothecium vesticola]
MKRIVGTSTPEGGAEEGSSIPTPEQPSQKPKASNTPGTMGAKRGFLPPEIMAILAPSLQVGTGVGAVGLFAGAVHGIAKSGSPILFSLVTGVQWFALSSSYMGARTAGLRLYGGDGHEVRPIDKLKVSTAAGGFAGMVAGALRGASKNIIYGTIAFSCWGGVGQLVMNAFGAAAGKASENKSDEPRGGILGSKYSPLTFLSDKEYETILEEKLLRIEAEIAVVDDNIKELRDNEAKVAKQSPGETQGLEK